MSQLFSNNDNHNSVHVNEMKKELKRLQIENGELKKMNSNEGGKREDILEQVSAIKEDIAQSLKKTTIMNKKLKKENEDLLKELKDLRGIKKENSEMRALKRENDRLLGLIDIEKQAVIAMRSKNKKNSEELLNSSAQIEKSRKENTKLKLRIKSLEMEVDVLKRRKVINNTNNDDNRSVYSHRSNKSTKSNASVKSRGSNVSLKLGNSGSKYSNSYSNPNAKKSTDRNKNLNNSNGKYSRYSNSPVRPLLNKSNSNMESKSKNSPLI